MWIGGSSIPSREISEGMVIAMQVALQEVPVSHDHAEKAEEVHAELEKHMKPFTAQGNNKI